MIFWLWFNNKIKGTTDSSLIYCRYKEFSIGNFIVDGFKWSGNSEISIVNGRGIRSNLNKRDLTRSQIVTASPFFNNIIVKRLPGYCILDALEHGVENLPNSAGSFLQISGLSYYVDTNFNNTVLTDSHGLFWMLLEKEEFQI